MADQSSTDENPPSSGMQMSLEEKLKIIRSVREECIQKDKLLNLLNHQPLRAFLQNAHYSDEINSRASEYWPLVMDIARRNKLPRIISEQDELSTAQILYPCMQCADIFFLKADICQLGMDQRKVNVLAREYCDDIKRKNKPIILSHRIVLLQYLFCKDRRKCPKSLTKTNYFEMLEELDISDNQIRVLPKSFRLWSKLRVFRADETPLEVPLREVIKLGAQVMLIWLQI
ncbi:hypothetical protein E1A91_D04G110800v1 [Gossypium mustelinum]|uniref:tyrosine--tRNA ligase n=1 Tax=Gossypium mustelinum TaxID=34275 RepID=A0A5D2VCI1_GOSMU|nr:hypothetical protein E1A91_D04G110800v1 [Gossypium mustelinum]